MTSKIPDPGDPHATEAHLPSSGAVNERNQHGISANSRWIGPYCLIEKLGQGGMGTVWHAEQESPVRRQVALKLIRSSAANSEFLSRFASERQALSVMNHPNIARFLDAGTTSEGEPYYVMELVAGSQLTAYCDGRRLPVEDRLRLFVQACNGVYHAHQRGIIHRDLKPGNILVCEVDGEPVPKVIDFGLAKAVGEQHLNSLETQNTAAGQILGTPQYMSPEQANLQNADIDVRTDVYSMGVILYELLAGSTPLDQQAKAGKDLFQVLQAVRELEPVRPSVRIRESSANSETVVALRSTDTARLQRALTGDLDWIAMRALEKDRNERYDTISALSEDVNRFLLDEPIVARPKSLGYRLRKYVKRHKRRVVSIAIFMTLAMLATTVSIWLRESIRREALSKENELEISRKLGKELADRRRMQLISASQRGNWDDVLMLANEQLQESTEDPVWWRLKKVQGLHEKTEYPAARSEIELARTEPGADAYRGQLLLWEAELKLLSRPDESRELVVAALGAGLPEAEEHYARSLIATSTRESEEWAQKAIAAYSFDVRFYRQLIVNRFLRGAHEEVLDNCEAAIRLFPDDSAIRLIRALSTGLSGDETGLADLLASDERMSDTDRKVVTSLCRDAKIIGEFLVNFDRQQLPYMVQVRLLATIMSLDKQDWFQELGSRAGSASLTEVGKIASEVYQTGLLGGKDAQLAVAHKAAELAERTNNGMMHLLASYLYFANDQFDQAVAEMTAASGTNWVIPYSRNDALFLASFMAVKPAQDHPSPENTLRIRKLLRELLEKGIPDSRKDMFVRIAIKYEEPLMALQILEQMPAEQQESVEWLSVAGKAAMAAGMLSRARGYCQQILAIRPDDAGAIENLGKIRAEVDRLLAD